MKYSPVNPKFYRSGNLVESFGHFYYSVLFYQIDAIYLSVK